MPGAVDILLPTFVAICLGALVGLERQVAQEESGGEKDFPGVRTFAFLALLGALAVLVAETLGTFFAVALFLASAMLLVLRYSHDASKRGDPGYTTELASLCIFAIGALAQSGRLLVAAVITISMVALLRSKRALHKVSELLDPREMEALIRFLVITGIVWPLLPDDPLSSFFSVLRPRDVWRMVVLISGISFVGYALMRLRPHRSSHVVLGLLGGLVSSTATTVTYARMARERPGATYCAPLVVLAATAAIARMSVMLLVIHPRLLPAVAAPLGAMLGLGLLFGLLWQPSQSGPETRPVFENPLELRLAFSFAAVYAGVLVLVAAAGRYLGDIGVYALSASVALVGADAPSLSLARLAADGGLDAGTAAVGVVIVAMSTTAAKTGIALVFGGPAFARRVVPALAAMAAAGGIALRLG